MLLIDEILAYTIDPPGMHSALDVTARSMFFDEQLGYLPVWLSFEYIAQSIATLSGIIGSKTNKTPKIGFIMGVRDFTAETEGFYSGDRVEIKIEQIFREGNVAVFNGQVLRNGAPACFASVNAVEADENLITKMRGDSLA